MLCLVRQANAVILEVEVDYKAKGQECLDKVSQTSLIHLIGFVNLILIHLLSTKTKQFNHLNHSSIRQKLY